MNSKTLLGGLAAVCISAAAIAQEQNTTPNPQVKPPLADQSGDLSDKLQRNDGVIKPPAVDSNMPTPAPSTRSDMPVIKPSETPPQQTDGPSTPR